MTTLAIINIDQNFVFSDLNDVYSVHKLLFENVYEWADQIKIVKKVQDVVTKDLGLSADLKTDIKKLISKDITVDKVLPLLKKVVSNPNKTFNDVVDYLKTLK